MAQQKQTSLISSYSMIDRRHSQLENELSEIALRRLLNHDVAHFLAHRSNLRRLRVASLLNLVVLFLRETNARLKQTTIGRGWWLKHKPS